MTPSPENLPRHVAIIMDGNGRWAHQRGLPRIEGHRAGADRVREIVRAAGEIGIQYLTLYAFSVENWNRPQAEIGALMQLLQHYLSEEVPELAKNNVRLAAVGRLDDLPDAARSQLDEAIRELSGNTGLTLVLALSYGGRTELVDAVRSIGQELQSGRLEIEQIDEETISRHLYTEGIPDPDLLVRTSGEMRVSNFFLWQISYAEIYVTETLWPDFDKASLLQALEEYARRHRRFGRVTPGEFQ